VDVVVMTTEPWVLGLPDPTVMLCFTSDAAAKAPLPGSLKSITQTPLSVKVTLPSLRVHPVDSLFSEISTLSPEVTDAVGVYVWWMAPAPGGVLAEMILDEWTVTECWTWLAAAKAPLPGSLKFTMQVPELLKSIQPEFNVQPLEFLSRVITTLSPDVAVAPGEYAPPALPAEGKVVVEIVLELYTLVLRWTWAAAAYVLFPASLKSTRHVPDPVKVTFPLLSEHPEELLSRVIATLSPDDAVALGV
jgi:hypothetical protein